MNARWKLASRSTEKVMLPQYSTELSMNCKTSPRPE